jgi:hypothetical protein
MKKTGKKQALKDIAKHIRETGKFVSHMQDVWWDTWCVTPSFMDNKETALLNKQLGL